MPYPVSMSIVIWTMQNCAIVFFRLEILATKREKLYLCIRLNNSTFGS